MSYNYFKNGVLNLIAGKHPTDKALSATSNHPVANRILKAKFDEQQTAIDGINTHLSNLPKIKTYNYVNTSASPSGIFAIPTSNIPAYARVLGINGSPIGKQFDVYHDNGGRTCIAMRDPVSLALDTTNGINVKIDYIEN